VKRISEAASIAMHTAVFLAGRPGRPVTSSEIAERTHVSVNHLVKVLQRLSRAGLVSAVRGPGGGFRLARPAEKISLLDVYEAIDGAWRANGCLFGLPVCDGGECVMGPLLRRQEEEMRSYLKQTPLRSLVGVYKRGDEDEA
jgi:Rrf2 family protein